MKNKSRDLSSFMCLWNECNTEFATSKSLFDHVNSSHIGYRRKMSAPYFCQWSKCTVEKVFHKRDHLLSHLLVHIPVYKYVCPYKKKCSKSFKRPWDRKKHIQKHEMITSLMPDVDIFREYSTSDLCYWISKTSLAALASTFQKNQINGKQLLLAVKEFNDVDYMKQIENYWNIKLSNKQKILLESLLSSVLEKASPESILCRDLNSNSTFTKNEENTKKEREVQFRIPVRTHISSSSEELDVSTKQKSIISTSIPDGLSYPIEEEDSYMEEFDNSLDLFSFDPFEYFFTD